MSKTIKLEDKVYHRLDNLRGKRETFSDVVAKLLTTKEAADTLAGIWHNPDGPRDQQTKYKGGRTMECPLMVERLKQEPEYTEPVRQDCLGKDCAWWNEERHMCCASRLSEQLENLTVVLEAIRDRMPPVQE